MKQKLKSPISTGIFKVPYHHLMAELLSLFPALDKKSERERCKGEGIKCSHEYKNLTSGMACLRKHQRATQIESRDKQSERLLTEKKKEEESWR